MRVSSTKRRRPDAQERKFRDAVWKRDGYCDRVSGLVLPRDGDEWTGGQVCHLASRAAHPERKYDVSNAFLTTGYFHALSDARGNHRLKILGTDANGPLTFRMTDKTGRVLWERTSSPPSVAIDK